MLFSFSGFFPVTPAEPDLQRLRCPPPPPPSPPSAAQCRAVPLVVADGRVMLAAGSAHPLPPPPPPNPLLLFLHNHCSIYYYEELLIGAIPMFTMALKSAATELAAQHAYTLTWIARHSLTHFTPTHSFNHVRVVRSASSAVIFQCTLGSFRVSVNPPNSDKDCTPGLYLT